MACPYCGHDHEALRCERVRAVEHAADGSVLKIEAMGASVIVASRPSTGMPIGRHLRGQ